MNSDLKYFKMKINLETFNGIELNKTVKKVAMKDFGLYAEFNYMGTRKL